jgi:adenylate kinase family enzyme
LRSPTRRFTTFWLAKGEQIEEAKSIIQQRRAEVIPIESADQFFTELQEKVKSLQELDRFPPLSTAVAVATVKRYLAEHRHRVRLHDLVHEETEVVCKELLSERFDTQINNLTEEVYQQRMHEYEALVERLIAMCAALSYHDTGENAHLLTRCIVWLTQVPRRDGNVVLIELQYYPALLLAYAAGISALAARRFHNLAAILKEPKYRESPYDEKKPAIERLNVESVFREPKWVPRQNAVNNAPNDYLSGLLRPILHDYLPEDAGYEETFDTFEYLLALTYLDIVSESYAPNGRFGWRYTGRLARASGLVEEIWDRSPLAEFVRTGVEQGPEWGLLKAGFFNGSIKRFKEIMEIHKKLLQNQTRRLI